MGGSFQVPIISSESNFTLNYNVRLDPRLRLDRHTVFEEHLEEAGLLTEDASVWLHEQKEAIRLGCRQVQLVSRPLDDTKQKEHGSQGTLSLERTREYALRSNWSWDPEPVFTSWLLKEEVIALFDPYDARVDLASLTIVPVHYPKNGFTCMANFEITSEVSDEL